MMSSMHFSGKYLTILVILVATMFTTSLRCRYSLKRVMSVSDKYSRKNPQWIPIRLTMSSGHDLEWPVSRVRSQFIDYFVNKQQHIYYKSSPVVPVNDPTLLFANAGMNQFKPIFLGTVDPLSPYAGLKRAVNSQKCIRAGGKHNDLEDVGKDTYHHTFFEMLGTWSFGNYFKKEAIDWAYDILVNVYKLPKERLYASYFGGDASLGLEPDNEARDLWLQYLPIERVLPFDKKANFWEMGETGPCGPCSEIHFDRIGNRDASALVNADDPDVIEIWNLVFIQFNREKSGELRTLPDKHIDTGMGLERLTSILQDKRSNYDTDVFLPIFKAIQEKIKTEPYSGKLGVADSNQGYRDTAYRVIADHIRTLSFAITDGAVPSNEGRGYVLRRILRRAVRYGMQTLGAKPGFFAELVPVVVQEFGQFYPELKEKKDFVMSVISDEEQSFANMVERGVKYFNEIVSDVKSSKATSSQIPGDRAFYLYDSLGFPIDLTQLMAQEQGLTVDMAGFEASMTAQKERGRAANRSKRLSGLDSLSLAAEQTSFLQKSNILPTDNAQKYEWDIAPLSDVKAVYLGDNKFSSALTKDDIIDKETSNAKSIGLILSSSPFYAESGGQVSDTGDLTVTLADGTAVSFDVVDVQVYGGYILHTCVLADDSGKALDAINVLNFEGAKAVSKVDYSRRRKIAPNHTMTHVLNFALRDELKLVVDQKGSQVNDEKLRFDFSLNRPLEIPEIEAIESKVNQIISKELIVSSEVLPLKDAQSINGLRAVFGEVYPDPVRVISVGAQVLDVCKDPSSSEWLSNSIEFCGGTHISNTAEAQSFVIMEETAVAKGIRRISAVTGDNAIKTIENSKKLDVETKKIRDEIKGLPTTIREFDPQLRDKIESLDNGVVVLRNKLDASTISYITKSNLRSQIEKLQKDLIGMKTKLMMSQVDKLLQELIEQAKDSVAQGSKAAVYSIPVVSDAKVIKKVTDEVRKVTADGLSFLLLFKDVENSKTAVFAFANDEAQKNGLKANEWVNKALEAVGGRGGGKTNAAQGSVNDISKVDEIYAQALVHLNNTPVKV